MFNLDFYFKHPTTIQVSGPIGGWTDELYEILRPDEKNLLIIDYQITEAGDSKTLANLFTKKAHHKILNGMYLVQNVYNKTRN